MFLVLLLFWIIFNGRITLEILLVGAVICGVLTFVWHRLFHQKHNTLVPSVGLLIRSLRYVWNLVIEIIRCNLQVMRLVLHPREEIRPQLLTFRTGLKKDYHKVILANAITLTPGTITVGLRDDLIRVHGLDASFLEGIQESDMVTMLEEMEDPKNG